jgi:thymidylate kinase
VSAGDAVAGRFVSVEGIDGCGKSAVARRLVGRLATAGAAVLLLDRHSATDGLSGYPAAHLAAHRALIWDYPPDAVTSELGFGHWSHLVSAWFHAVDELVVLPALRTGRLVVADSWYAKFAARFALTVGVPDAERIFAGISVPDTVLWLDVPPEDCVRRRTRPRATESGEWQGLGGGDADFVAYQGTVRSVYQRFAATGVWHRIGPADLAGTVTAAYDRMCHAGPAGRAVEEDSAHDEREHSGPAGHHRGGADHRTDRLDQAELGT